MILATHGIIGSGAAFDADAVAFFNRVTTAGGTLSTTEKQAVNSLVVDMKAAGIWSGMKAIYPMVGASAASCAQNLKSSSFTGTFSSGWTFASTGVLGNGLSSYFDTNFNQTTQSQAQNNTYLSVYIRNNNIGGYDMGNGLGFSTVSTYLIARYGAGLNYLGIGDGSYGTSTSSTDSRGLWSGGTNGSAAQILYRNGSSTATGTSPQIGVANNNLYLGAFNNAGAANVSSSHEYAFSTISNGLSATQNTDFYTAVQAFQTTLSRQV